MEIFNVEGRLMKYMNSIVDFMYLNILAIVCSLPVLTIGAATTAKYYVGMKMLRGEAPSVTQSFFRSFRENFRQSLWLELFAAILLLILAGDWYVVLFGDLGRGKNVVFVITVLFTMVALCILCYLFPLLARFHFCNRQIVKFAFMTAVTNIGNTLFLILYAVFVYGASLYLYALLPIVYFVTSSVSLILSSAVYVRVFKKIEPASAGEAVEQDEEAD